jgi:hypothetical protein
MYCLSVLVTIGLRILRHRCELLGLRRAMLRAWMASSQTLSPIVVALRDSLALKLWLNLMLKFECVHQLLMIEGIFRNYLLIYIRNPLFAYFNRLMLILHHLNAILYHWLIMMHNAFLEWL